MNSDDADKQAVVPSGNGAHGAYAVGVMKALRTGTSPIGEVGSPTYNVERSMGDVCDA